MAVISVIGLDSLNLKLNRLEREVFPKAAVRSLNRTARKVRTIARRSTAKRMGLAQKAIKSRMDIDKARPNRLTVLVTGRGKPFNLIRFGARQIKRGVSAKPWGKRRVFRGAFIATMPNGKRIVVARRGEARLPLKALFGPGLARTMADEEVVRAMETTGSETLEKEMRNNLRFFAGKLRGAKRR